MGDDCVTLILKSWKGLGVRLYNIIVLNSFNLTVSIAKSSIYVPMYPALQKRMGELHPKIGVK